MLQLEYFVIAYGSSKCLSPKLSDVFQALPPFASVQGAHVNWIKSVFKLTYGSSWTLLLEEARVLGLGFVAYAWFAVLKCVRHLHCLGTGGTIMVLHLIVLNSSHQVFIQQKPIGWTRFIRQVGHAIVE